MNNKRENNDFNPYDLNQVSKKRNGRSGVVRKRSRSDDPYSASSSAYGIRDNSGTYRKNK